MKTFEDYVVNDLSGYAPGTIITVTLEDGVVNSKFWRRRIEDAKFDNCISRCVKAEAKSPKEKK